MAAAVVVCVVEVAAAALSGAVDGGGAIGLLNAKHEKQMRPGEQRRVSSSGLLQ